MTYGDMRPLFFESCAKFALHQKRLHLLRDAAGKVNTASRTVCQCKVARDRAINCAKHAQRAEARGLAARGCRADLRGRQCDRSLSADLLQGSMQILEPRSRQDALDRNPAEFLAQTLQNSEFLLVDGRKTDVSAFGRDRHRAIAGVRETANAEAGTRAKDRDGLAAKSGDPWTNRNGIAGPQHVDRVSQGDKIVDQQRLAETERSERLLGDLPMAIGELSAAGGHRTGNGDHGRRRQRRRAATLDVRAQRRSKSWKRLIEIHAILDPPRHRSCAVDDCKPSVGPANVADENRIISGHSIAGGRCPPACLPAAPWLRARDLESSVAYTIPGIRLSSPD